VRWIRTRFLVVSVKGDRTAVSKTGAELMGNRKFESISLQRGVNCELATPDRKACDPAPMGARRSTQRRTGNMSKISRRLAGLRPAFAPRPCAYPTDIPQALFDSPTVTRRDVLSTRTSGTRHSPALRTRFHMPRARRVKSRRRSCRRLPPRRPPARPSPHSSARPGAGF